MPYNPNPYYQPYGAPNYNYGQSFQQPQQQSNTYAFVNGIEGAKAYPMYPNQTVMLMDNDNPIAYMKQSNGMGQATIKYFRLVETTEAELKGSPKPSVEYVTKEEFLAFKESMKSKKEAE